MGGATAWLDKLGEAQVCSASPKPCQFYSNFFEAAEVCRSEGGRLCTQAEILNNEAAGTGCSMDALEVWTSSRGKCAEGEFMTMAGAAYNAVPLPLGLGLPGCTSVTEQRSVRCCADDVVKPSTCPSSTATCQELGWPIVTSDESVDAFCPMNTLYNCADGANICYEQFARSCTADELLHAASFVAGFPDGVQAQLSSSRHGMSDKCMCCADTVLMPEPCIRPYRVRTSSNAKQLAFGVDKSETRLCSWVFDGCAPGEGVELTFKEAHVADSIPGDGWKVFAANSPVDLLNVQNKKFSRASVLAEIRSSETRTFRRSLHDSATRIIPPHGAEPSPRTAATEFVVRSPLGAIVELRATKGASAASFAVEHKCAPVSSGCMDRTASNFQIDASHDDGSCEYSRDESDWTDPYPDSEYRCTNNPRSTEDECTCAVIEAGEFFFFDTMADQIVRSADPFESVVAPYVTESCNSSMTSSEEWIGHVNAAIAGLHWLRFYGALLHSESDLHANHETVIIEGITSNLHIRPSLPELNVRITATNRSRAFVRRVAVRNKVAEGNAPVAYVGGGSIMLMQDVLLENNCEQLMRQNSSATNVVYLAYTNSSLFLSDRNSCYRIPRHDILRRRHGVRFLACRFCCQYRKRERGAGWLGQCSRSWV
eukprot:COSAG02_NODE_6062_length_3833_cov_1.835297_1_plen_654_part_00